MKTTISKTAAQVQPLPPEIQDEPPYTPGELLHGPEHEPDDEPMHVDLLQLDGCGFAERQMAKVYFGQDLEQIRANAKRLAHCWNHHDELVEALQRLLDVPEPMTATEHFDYSANAQRLARAILAQVKG